MLIRFQTTQISLLDYTLSTYFIWGVCVDPRPLSTALDPRPLALSPHLVGPSPPKYCKNKFMNKGYYWLKIILIQA